MLFKRSLIGVSLFLCVSPSWILMQAQAAQSDSQPEAQLAQVERDWLAADTKGDVSRLRQLVADDFMGSTSDGSLLNKDDIIPEAGQPGGFAGATPGPTNFRVFGDTGVLMGVIQTAGKPQGKQIYVTLVCQKRTRGWQIIAARLTPM